MSRKDHITVLLNQWQSGERDALNRLLPLVYEELCNIARGLLKTERHNAIFKTRVLVHEAYLRLCGQKGCEYESRVHFYGIASRVMRQILVDHARGQAAEKRGGQFERIHVEDIDGLTGEQNIRFQRLNLALDALADFDPHLCRVVEMRYFGGLTIEETAQALGISPATLKRDWSFAKAWLLRNMSE